LCGRVAEIGLMFLNVSPFCFTGLQKRTILADASEGNLNPDPDNHHIVRNKIINGY
jgi:hypothetical protein